jgi:hypothetical protein
MRGEPRQITSEDLVEHAIRPQIDRLKVRQILDSIDTAAPDFKTGVLKN